MTDSSVPTHKKSPSGVPRGSASGDYSLLFHRLTYLLTYLEQQLGL